VDLDFKPDTEARLVGGDLPYPEIPTAEAGLEKFTKELKELPLKDAIGNFSAALASVKDFMGNPELKETVHNLNQTILEIKKVVNDVDVDVVKPLKKTVQDADQLVADVDKLIKPLSTKFGKMADSITKTSDTARPAIKNVGDAFGNIKAMTGRGSKERKKLDDMLDQLAGAARAIKNWADYLERHPEALIRGKGGSKTRR
jgi:paraquat-inducible protein B